MAPHGVLFFKCWLIIWHSSHQVVTSNRFGLTFWVFCPMISEAHSAKTTKLPLASCRTHALGAWPPWGCHALKEPGRVQRPNGVTPAVSTHRGSPLVASVHLHMETKMPEGASGLSYWVTLQLLTLPSSDIIEQGKSESQLSPHLWRTELVCGVTW